MNSKLEVHPLSKSQIEEEHVAQLVLSESWKQTIGKWLAEDEDAALRTVMEDETENGLKAKGAYIELRRIRERINFKLEARQKRMTETRATVMKEQLNGETTK